MIRWLVAKYMPDLRRREPINIGVLVMNGDGKVRPRFLSGSNLRGSVRSNDNLHGWIEYWRHRCVEASWDELVAEARHREPSNYFLEVGGETIVTDRTADEFAEYLFVTLVRREAPRRWRAAPEALFKRLGISPEEDVMVEVAVRRTDVSLTDEVFFDYRHINGRASYMRQLTLSSGRAAWGRVHDAQHSFDALSRATIEESRGPSIALVSRAADVPEAQIRLLRSCCEIVDLSDEIAAAGRLRSLLALH